VGRSLIREMNAYTYSPMCKGVVCRVCYILSGIPNFGYDVEVGTVYLFITVGMIDVITFPTVTHAGIYDLCPLFCNI
jgi:hypothetical protein